MANFTVLTFENIQSILQDYDIGVLESAAPLAGGQANSSYKLVSSSGSFTLSVCDEKTTQEITALTRVLNYLENHKFPTTRLIKTVRGDNFVTYEKNPVYIKQFLDGEIIRELDCSMLEQVGSTLGRLHQLDAPDWLPHTFAYGSEQFDGVLNSDISHPFKEWLQEKSDTLQSKLDLNQTRGFIHGDAFWDNLLFEEGTLIAVLDFEEACQYFLLYDLGMAAVGCCATNGEFNTEAVNNLVRGYQSHYPLTDSEKNQFIPFLIYAATASAFWRFRQYNIRHPNPSFADNYKELVSLADNPPTIYW